MNMSLRSIDERLGNYDVGFEKLRKKAKHLRLNERFYMRKYIEGLRPEDVRRELLAELETEGVTMTDIKEKAKLRLTEENKHYVREIGKTAERVEFARSAPAAKTSSGYTGGGPVLSHSMTDRRSSSQVSQPPVGPRVHQSPSVQESYKTHLRGGGERRGLCNQCLKKGIRVDWTPEHWASCPGNKHRMGGQAELNKPATHNGDKPKLNTVYISKPDDESKKRCASVQLAGLPNEVSVIVAGQNFVALADTGATVSCISRALATRLATCGSVSFAPASRVVVMGDGRECTSSRNVTLSVRIATPRGISSAVTVDWVFCELPDDANEKLILGLDVMRALGMLTFDVENSCYQLMIPIDRADDVHTPFEEETLEPELETAVDCCSIGLVEVSAPMEDAGVEEWQRVVVPESDIAPLVRDLLKEYGDVFDSHLPKEGADFPEMPIRTFVDKVIHMPPRRLNEELADKVQKLLREQKEIGIIRDATSMQSMPLVVVKKKGGELRVCVDFTELNKITIPHEYPIPRIGQLLLKHMGCRFNATFDMRQGYYQMRLEESSKPLTGAVAPASATEPKLHFEYEGVAMGLTNAVAYYQEAMEYTFQDLMDLDDVGIYVDDVVIGGKTTEEFLGRIRRFLQRCREKRIRLKAPKCVVGSPEVSVLGQVISEQGRRMTHDRVAAVAELNPPRDIHELRAFLGLVHYFQDFIPRLADIIAPLNELERKDVPYEWTKERLEAFRKIKAEMTAERLLASPTDEGELILRTDASGIGIGGVLLLKNNEGARPICFFSHTLSETQRRWSTYDQELFAILFCVSREPYKSLLMLRSFVIETDHRNLLYLSQADGDKNHKLWRWKAVLMQYKFEIRHIAGSTNTVADALSRLNHDIAVECNEERCNAVGVNAQDNITRHSDQDSALALMIEEAQGSLTPEDIKRIPLIKDARGTFRTTAGLVFVPTDAKAVKAILLRSAHGTPFLGHHGSRVTIDNIRRAGFWWDNIYAEVESHVKACASCQKTRLHQNTCTEMKTTSEVFEAFHTVAMDNVGPFPADKDGNKYLDVMIDIASGYVELKPGVDTSAETAAEALYSEIFARHGLPKCLRTDNGPEYSNQVIEALCRKLDVRHHLVLPYHPQSNGVVERVNGEILRQLRCLLLDFKSAGTMCWSEILPMVKFTINNTVHSSTGVTPHAFLYGDFLTPANDMPSLLLDNSARIEEGTGKQYIDKLKARLVLLRNGAEKVRREAIEARLKRHNAEKPTEYVLGEFVLVSPVAKTSKLLPKWLGPYKIVEVVYPQIYRLQHLFDPSRTFTVHHGRMKPFALSGELVDDDYKALLDADDNEYLVEHVVSHTGSNKRNVRFRIRWSGYGPEHDTEEPWSHVEGNVVVENYIAAHPQLKGLLGKRQAED